jgi:octaprenyl-diphosphate synthase
MLHTATLVHDDIIDNAELRRNRPSVNARFGNQKAVLMGDWLYMSAFETSLQERSLEILDILTVLTRQMTEGELIQTTTVGDIDISELQYFDILKRKTAYLFSACCEIGAILGGGGKAEREALRDYGLDLGVAFQLLDDVLDVTSNADKLGKEAGSDLLEGKVTLPILLLLEAEPTLRPILQQVISDRAYSTISRSDLLQKLSFHRILEHVRERAVAHCERARKSLDILLKTEYRLRLADVLSFVIDRQS